MARTTRARTGHCLHSTYENYHASFTKETRMANGERTKKVIELLKKLVARFLARRK